MSPSLISYNHTSGDHLLAKCVIVMINNFLSARHIFYVFAAMVAVHVFAIRYGFYIKDVWIDMPLHVAGGFLAGMVALWLMCLDVVRSRMGDLNIFATSFVIISFALFGSFIWELMEFLLFFFFENLAKAGKFYSPTTSDLLSDMVLGVLGSVLFVIFWVYVDQRNQKSLKK